MAPYYYCYCERKIFSSHIIIIIVFKWAQVCVVSRLFVFSNISEASSVPVGIFFKEKNENNELPHFNFIEHRVTLSQFFKVCPD